MGMLQTMMGMGGMTEQIIATDFLLAAKAGVRNYAVAVSEAATPLVRDILRRHLYAALENHEKITAYMMNNGYYHVHDPKEQLALDLESARTVLQLHQG